MRRYVFLECGHQFRESTPDGVAESSPRVCSVMDHAATDPGVLWMTNQRMAMSNVIAYIPDSDPDPLAPPVHIPVARQ